MCIVHIVLFSWAGLANIYSGLCTVHPVPIPEQTGRLGISGPNGGLLDLADLAMQHRQPYNIQNNCVFQN
jgi:hypothetical protein